MNVQNFDYLKDSLKYLGFGEQLNEALNKKMAEGLTEFSITHRTEINRKPFEAALHFRKSDSTDLYFLNGYSASLQRSNGEKIEQSFYLNNGKGVTAKEAYNLLEGRSVYKELTKKNGEKYHAWLHVDFSAKDKRGNYEMKQYHEHYGFDLKEAVSRLAVKELADPEKEKALYRSLERGNVQGVTIEKDGAVHKMFLEANPQFKAVTLYNADFKRVQKEDMGKYMAEPPSKKEGESQEQSKEMKRDKKNGMEVPGAKKGRRSKKSVGM